MTIEFREPKRENAPLLIGLAGGTGSGKTFSALRLARGLANGQPFAVIDTENGRALHYTDFFPDMRHGDLKAPFSPEAYADAIAAADAAGYPVVVVDSTSHIWEGEGGVLDMQLAEVKRLGSGDNMKMLTWVAPKQAHKAFVRRLLQVKAHVILCLRAEDKIDFEKDDRGKTVVVPKKTLKGAGLDGWIPICEKRLPFELTLSFLLTSEQPGIPKPIKLQEQHRAFVPLDQPISEDTGRALAAWAAGAQSSGPGPQTGHGRPSAPVSAATPATGGQPSGLEISLASETQRRLIFKTAKEHEVSDDVLRSIFEEHTGQQSSAAIPAAKVNEILADIEATPLEAAADAAAETRAPGGGDGQQVEESGDLRGSPAVGAEPTGNPGSAPDSSTPDTGEDPEPRGDEDVEAAGALIIPDGNHKGQPINAVADPTWIKWALRQSKYHKPVDEFPAIHDALETWVRAKKPELAIWYQAWLDAGSPVGPAFENWSKERRAA